MVGQATDTRLQVLKYIVEYLEGHRYAPTRQEISDALGLKTRSAVQYHIESLIETGHLERSRYRHRIVRATDKGRAVIDKLKEIESEAGSQSQSQ